MSRPPNRRCRHRSTAWCAPAPAPRNGGWNDSELTELFRAHNPIEGFDPLPDGQPFLLTELIPSPADSLIRIATGW